MDGCKTENSPRERFPNFDALKEGQRFALAMPLAARLNAPPFDHVGVRWGRTCALNRSASMYLGIVPQEGPADARVPLITIC